MTKVIKTYEDLNIGDIFIVTNEYGGKCEYKLIKEVDGKIELINLTLLKEPFYVTKDWFENKDITEEGYF